MPDAADPFATRAPDPIGTRQPSGGAFEPSTDLGDFAPATDTETAGELTGEVVGFRILGEIARGGMGIVYRALDIALNRGVAVKVLQERFRQNPVAAARFVEEAQITAQLQHPGVPPVHQVGSLPDGRPFLVMKLIKGRTLADLLSDPSWDRSQAAGAFEQICHTVAYAHNHGIIHRDLKPHNVMIGRFGEVQVMDWGLAKFRSTGRGDPGATTAATTFHDPRAAGNELATHAGSILGTPAYMPPEQAIGAVDKVDERSDVFGLGAIMCAVLTGRPPYVGADPESTRQLAARAALDDAHARLARCGADPELVALCKRCLTPDPADRPANSGEVAKAVVGLRAAADERARQAELDRVRAEGERSKAEAEAREQRKRRRVLLAAGGMIGGVLATGLGVSLWQMNRANAERDAKDHALTAESRARADEKQARDRAFDALRAMTAEFVERRFQAGRGYTLTDEDRAFLGGVIEQYEAFAGIQGDDADSRAVRAEGRYRVGLMRHHLGELAAAEADLGAAVGIFQQLAADFPDRPEYRWYLVVSHKNRGGVRRDTGRPKEAEADLEAALGILQQLAADFPTRPEFRAELAKSHNDRGVIWGDMGQVTKAEAEYDAALAIHKRLAADFPDRPEFREELAVGYLNRGNLRGDTGRPKEAEADLQAARGILQQLAADFPARPEYRRELAGSNNDLGVLRRATGRPKEAEADYDAALAIHKRLAADFPTRPEYRRDLAMSHNNRGNLRADTARPKEAEADYDAALGIRQQLAADFPDRPEYRRDLAISHNDRGALRANTGRPKEAEADYDAALGIQKQLAVDLPTQPDIRNGLAIAYMNLARLQQRRKNWAEAKRLLLEGRPHHLAALKAIPAHRSYRGAYRSHLVALVEIHSGLLEPAEAVRAAESLRDLGWNAPGDAYDAACSLSLCIPIVESHDELSESQRKDAARFYGDAAMKLLRQAVSKGWKDAAHMKKDTDLDPLRGHLGFQKLLAELEMKGK